MLKVEHAEGIASVALFPAAFCKRLIEKCEALGTWGFVADNWERKSGAGYSGKEIGVDELGPVVHQRCLDYLGEHYQAITDQYGWEPRDLDSMFINRHSADGIKHMPAHRDVQSILSGIVKLNDNYEGGETYFEDLEWDNSDVPVGSMTLFPGITSHQVMPVTSGVRYNATIWFSGITPEEYR